MSWKRLPNPVKKIWAKIVKLIGRKYCYLQETIKK